MDAGRLRKVKFGADVPCHSKVRVLVDALGDEAGYNAFPKDLREAGGDARRSLDGGVGCLPRVPGEVQSEDGLAGGKVDMPLEETDVGVELADVLAVEEDESLALVEPESENVLDVLESDPREPLEGGALAPEVLLVVGNLDNEGHVKGLLQILGEDEGHEVAHVQTVTGRAPPSVEVEGLTLFVLVKDQPQVPVAKEDPSAEHVVRGLASEGLEASEQGRVNFFAAESLDQLHVVDFLASLVLHHVGSHLDLLFCLLFNSRLFFHIIYR